MSGRRPAPCILIAGWLALGAFAAPEGSALPYDPAALLAGSAAGVLPPVEPGEQYPPSERERIASPASPPPGEPPAPPRRTSWTLTVGASVTGDSNITNGTGLDTVAVDSGSGPVPVHVEEAFRKRAALGLGASASAAVRVPVGDGNASLAFDAEGYAIRYPGEAGTDDSSALVAGGVALTGGSGSGALQAIAFDRWYGGESAMRGVGLRGNWRQDVGGGAHVALYVDARTFESDWGDPLTGQSASIYLAYDAPLDSVTTLSGGLYGRRDWMRDDAFSNLELGAYASLTHYLNADFTGGISAGVGRVRYDAPLVYLSPDARRDWRGYASVWLTTRKPVAFGLFPSLTYTYNRTSSSIAFYKADRHRLRLGVSRSF